MILVALLVILSVLPVSLVSETVNFQRDVRPILSDKCFHCHGPDKASRMAGLRMDVRESMFASRKNGAVVVVGKAEGCAN